MRDEVDDPHPEQKRPATPGLTKGINVYVPSRSSEKLRIDTRTARTIVEKVMRDPRIQRAAAKLAKAPAPAPFRKVATVPSEIPGMAKLVRQRAAVAEAVDSLRKMVRDRRAAQRDTAARLDRIDRTLGDLGEVAERISKVATGTEKIARVFEMRGLGLPRGGVR